MKIWTSKVKTVETPGFSELFSTWEKIENLLLSYLQGPEYARGGLEYAVDAVSYVEAVGPVMVGHRPVVLLHCDQEPDLNTQSSYE